MLKMCYSSGLQQAFSTCVPQNTLHIIGEIGQPITISMEKVLEIEKLKQKPTRQFFSQNLH